jgi:RNA polymerase sigma-70 factor, ECF subfamily
VESGTARAASGEQHDAVPRATPSLEQWYRDHFAFVWRSARRLGVQPAQLDDAVQDVFMIVQRKLGSYEPRHSPQAWLFAITRRVAADQRRSLRRKGKSMPLDEASIRAGGDDPLSGALRRERADVVARFLTQLDDHHRAVFILCELEQMSAPDIAHAVEANLATVYSRIRSARLSFVRYVKHHHPELMDDADG